MAMTILNWLSGAMQKLKKAGVDSPRRDALVLLEDLLNKDRSWVAAHAETKLNSNQINKLDKQIARRVNREPLAYIRGKCWFYGRFFNVSPDVMIPRPESESFIELLKNTINGSVKGPTFHIVDVGTGSGCLAVTAMLELPKCEVIATDVDVKALQIAKVNAKKYELDIEFLQSSMIESLAAYRLPHNVIIMANLPYVPEGLITSPEINYEQSSALFSGTDGLDHYRTFWHQAAAKPRFAEWILVESLINQHLRMENLAKKAGYKLIYTDVLVQLFQKLEPISKIGSN